MIGKSWWGSLLSLIADLSARNCRKRLIILNDARFRNLEMQRILYARRRELRSKQFREEVEGKSALSSGEFVVLSVDIPQELEALDAERVKIEKKMDRIRVWLERFQYSS